MKMNEYVLNKLEILNAANGIRRYRVVVRGTPNGMIAFRAFLKCPDYARFTDFKMSITAINSRFIDTYDAIAFQWTSPNAEAFLDELAALWPDLIILVEFAEFGWDQRLKAMSVSMRFRNEHAEETLQVRQSTTDQEVDHFWTDGRLGLAIGFPGLDAAMRDAFFKDILGIGIPLICSAQIE